MDIVKRELKHPVCLDGQQASPPEDTGGPRAYAALIKLLGTAPSENEEEQQRRDWIGEDFDPAYFNLKETNQILKIIS